VKNAVTLQILYKEGDFLTSSGEECFSIQLVALSEKHLMMAYLLWSCRFFVGSREQNVQEKRVKTRDCTGHYSTKGNLSNIVYCGLSTNFVFF
jgi:hypothetical protein